MQYLHHKPKSTNCNFITQYLLIYRNRSSISCVKNVLVYLMCTSLENKKVEVDTGKVIIYKPAKSSHRYNCLESQTN